MMSKLIVDEASPQIQIRSNSGAVSPSQSPDVRGAMTTSPLNL